jgi:polyhydroxyalkanoate synthesis regulator phasin
VGKTELFKRSLEMGTSFIDLTRERAEVLVKDLVDNGVVRKGQAEKTIDLLMERSRKRTEALGNLIRREVAEQLSAFGVATKEDIARLEAKLDKGTPAGAASRVKAPSRGTKASPITKSAKTAGAPRSSREPTAPPAMKPEGGSRRAGPAPTSPEAP